MSSRRARHRAPVARFAWASRALFAAASVPVGALAGCAVAAVSSSADRPEVGLAGLAAAGVPLGVHGWRQRTVRTAPRGRHAAGADGVAALWPVVEGTAAGVVAGEVLHAEVLHAPEAAAPSPRYLTVRLDAPRAPLAAAAVGAASTAAAEALTLIPRQRTAAVLATPRAAASELVFTVSATRRAVEAVPDVRSAEVAELQRIWDSGTGPATGPVSVLVPVLVPALDVDARRQHAA